MFGSLSVAVVMPAFNEAARVSRAVAAVPDMVDRLIVIDDASRDDTGRRALAAARQLGREPGRDIEVIRHAENRGVGAAIVTGYRRVLALGYDVAVVMAGDGQMDAADLPALLAPIAGGEADYVKGNRFRHRDVWRAMPATRIVGNLMLSTATKLTSGYWHVFDSQCGFTAITREALRAVALDRVFARYGYPNDVLARLHAARMRVRDVPVRPVYGDGWRSGIRPHMVVYPIAFVLVRSWLSRLRSEWGFAPALPGPGEREPEPTGEP